MTTAFIITSVIDPDRAAPLNYTTIRSLYDAEERFRQTVSTIACADTLTDDQTTIFLVDASPESYQEAFAYQRNLEFVDVRTRFPAIYEDIRINPNKTRGEALMLTALLGELPAFDRYVKLSGRYFLDRSFQLWEINDPFTIYFKHHLTHQWNPHWNWPLVDARAAQGDNTLRQFVSGVWAWGSRMLPTVRAMLQQVIDMGSYYDMETLLYFLSRPHVDSIVEKDWILYGWGATNGVFLRY